MGLASCVCGAYHAPYSQWSVWAALARENSVLWDIYYRPLPMYDHIATWGFPLGTYFSIFHIFSSE